MILSRPDPREEKWGLKERKEEESTNLFATQSAEDFYLILNGPNKLYKSVQ